MTNVEEGMRFETLQKSSLRKEVSVGSYIN